RVSWDKLRVLLCVLASLALATVTVVWPPRAPAERADVAIEVLGSLLAALIVAACVWGLSALMGRQKRHVLAWSYVVVALFFTPVNISRHKEWKAAAARGSAEQEVVSDASRIVEDLLTSPGRVGADALRDAAKRLDRISEAQQGDVPVYLRILVGALWDGELVTRRLEDARRAFDAAGGISHEGLLDASRLLDRQELAEQLVKAALDVDRWQSTLAGRCDRRLADAGIEAADRERYLASLRATAGLRVELSTAVLDSARSARRVIEVLHTHQGAWSIDASGALRFEEAGANVDYTSARRRMEAVDAEIRALEKRSLDPPRRGR
nr:hypothetical protein [Planctomycetota bacterium]